MFKGFIGDPLFGKMRTRSFIVSNILVKLNLKASSWSFEVWCAQYTYKLYIRTWLNRCLLQWCMGTNFAVNWRWGESDFLILFFWIMEQIRNTIHVMIGCFSTHNGELPKWDYKDSTLTVCRDVYNNLPSLECHFCNDCRRKQPSRYFLVHYLSLLNHLLEPVDNEWVYRSLTPTGIHSYDYECRQLLGHRWYIWWFCSV